MLCILGTIFAYQQKSIFITLWMRSNMENSSEYQKEQQEALGMIRVKAMRNGSVKNRARTCTKRSGKK
jgi:hypothetical protein